MKALLAICMIVVAAFVWAGETPVFSSPAPTVVKGEVLEVKDVESYTYLRLKTKDGETWAAVNKSPVRKGAEVTIENVMIMKNFESKALKKTFPTIVFGTLGGAGGSAQAAGKDMATAHSGVAKTADTGDIHVPKASGANARTVAEIMTKGAELKDKPVLVRGKVVKYNSQIMGKNWIHLRDGSGSAATGSNDVLVTTMSQAKTGDVVTVKGVVRTDKDFGAGYAYKVLIEDATLQQ
ncbi:nucleotide-binding protein [Sulfuricella sp. T08]|uniref:OB-fold nucleic acid binding domain-containing protein n=1 Tax=Sulfuricella sp. T08 TaxID=1632857 RepID=UPI0006179F31|nr:OB-fold nucleic acid binding domain-containing protein [Sulfuricella sp. T08]GAO37648.1 nucleotide-binding protein [Sulfuricella sp. T08]